MNIISPFRKPSVLMGLKIHPLFFRSIGSHNVSASFHRGPRRKPSLNDIVKKGFELVRKERAERPKPPTYGFRATPEIARNKLPSFHDEQSRAAHISLGEQSKLPVFNLSNHNVTVHYTSDLSEANRLLSILKGPYIGFNVRWPPSDAEWDQLVKDGFVSIHEKKKILVEVCDEDMVVIVQVDDELPTKVVDILENIDIFKIGNISKERHYYKLIQNFPKQFPIKQRPGSFRTVNMTTVIDIPIFIPSLNGRFANNSTTGMIVDMENACKPIGGVHPIRDLAIKTFGKVLPRCRWDTWRGMKDKKDIKDLATDVYVYRLLFKEALRYLADERGIHLGPNDHPKGNWLPLSRTMLESSSNSLQEQLDASPRGEDDIFRPGVLSERFFSEFREGKDIEEIVRDTGLSKYAVELWICQVTEEGGYFHMEDEDRERLWSQIGPVNPVWNTCKKLHLLLRSEFDASSKVRWIAVGQ